MTTFEDIVDPTGYRIFGRKPDMSGTYAANGVVSGPLGPSQSPEDRWCIAVIDVSNEDTPATMASRYATFRATWPNRKLFLLMPSNIAVTATSVSVSPPGLFYTGSTVGYDAAVFVPQQATNDIASGLFQTPIRVNRDAGVTGNRSDWFTLTGMGVLTTGAKVGLFVDGPLISASTVQASYDKFIADVAAAGLSIITVTDVSENWIGPFTAMSGT